FLLKPVQQSELFDTIWAVLSSSAEGAGLAGRQAPATSTGRSRSLHVLVVEDNELNVQVLRALLDQRGHSVEVAGDGRAALQLAATPGRTYDVMLLDLHMPEMAGFEVAQAIRAHERDIGTHLPIIALTARSSAQDREKALAAGMDDFLSKPVDGEALWSAIDLATADAPPAKRQLS